MQKARFYGQPQLAQDIFVFDDLKLYLNYDRKEKILEWMYESPDGSNPILEAAGEKLIGLTILDAWKLSSHFQGVAHSIYWQLGRLLGHWQYNAAVGNERLICRCFNVNESQILKRITEDKETDALLIRKATRASAGCGSCKQQVNQFIQAYCDQNALVIKGKTNPCGEVALKLLLNLSRALELWQKQNQEISSLSLLGIKDYTVFAKWNDSEEQLTEQFFTQVKNDLKINLTIHRYSV